MKFYQHWFPWTVYTVTRKDLDEWFENLGSNALYEVELWKPSVKSLSRSFVEVRFLKY